MLDDLLRHWRGAEGVMEMTPPSAAREMPHSAEAEQSLLGALLLDPAALALVSDLVTPASFYRHEHKLIFGAIEALQQAGQVADVVAVYERLRGQVDEPVQFGGLAYINDLAASVVSAKSARLHAEIIAERASERALIAGLDEAATIAWQGATPLDDRIESIGAVLRRVEQQRKAPGGHRVPLLGLDALRQHAESIRWLCKHRVPTDSVGMLFGGSGTFKSFIALDLALHVCHGLPWMGCKTQQGAVIFIAAEGGAGLWPRIAAWHRARGLDWRRAPLHVVPAALDLGAEAWRVVEAAQLQGVVPALVVVDTLSQTYAGEENSANEMAAYLRELGSRFRALWHCAVMVIHHSGHAATERPRGSSAIRGNVDFLLGCFRDEKEMLATLTCVKQKDGDEFQDATFQLTPWRLGVDEDGDEIRQLAARHLSHADEVSQAMEQEARSGRGGKNQLLLRLLTSGMQEKELRKAFYEDCGLDDGDARRQAYFRASSWAKKAGFYEVSDGVVIVTKAKG